METTPQSSDVPHGPGPSPLAGLTEGRVVHYVLPDGKRRGEHRAAVVSCVLANPDGGPSGCCHLNVFLNGPHDYEHRDYPGSPSLRFYVNFDHTGTKHGTWHWIERT